MLMPNFRALRKKWLYIVTFASLRLPQPGLFGGFLTIISGLFTKPLVRLVRCPFYGAANEP